MDIQRLTPTEQRMFDVLCDGELHAQHELHGCLYDELGPPRNVESHLNHLRRVLKEEGKTIRCFRIERRSYYRLVRIFSNPE